MAKNIYIYSYINNYAIESLNRQLDEVDDSEEITVRLNSPGGNVTSGYSFLSRLSERKGKTTAIIDGEAKSMAAVWLPFFDEVIANDTSEIMFHKAAYPSYYDPSEKEQESLNKTNAKFEEKIRKKVDGKPGAEKFLKTLFEEGKRNNVELTPEYAKKLGIVTSIRKLEPTAYSGMQIVAVVEDESKQSKTNTIKLTNPNSMEISQEELDKKLKEAKESGRKEEMERVAAWAAWLDVDKEAVKEALSNPDAVVNAKVQSEMIIKMQTDKKVEAHKEDNEQDVETPAEAKTEEQIQAEAVSKELDELLG